MQQVGSAIVDSEEIRGSMKRSLSTLLMVLTAARESGENSQRALSRAKEAGAAAAAAAEHVFRDVQPLSPLAAS